MKTKLRTKMIAFTIILVSVIMAAVTYFFTIREIDVKRDSLNSQIEKLAENIATLQLVDQQEWSTYQEYIDQLMETNADIVYIAVFDERNTLRAYTLNTDLVEIDYPVVSSRIEAQIVEQLDRGLVAEESRNDIQSARVNIMVNDRIIGSVHVGYSLININSELREGIFLNLILAAVFTIIFSFAAFAISRRLAFPLEQLNNAMQRVSKGDLTRELTPSTHDEIADLIGVYNDMIKNMRERKIIEALGNELSSVFRLEELTTLVSQHLKTAINAGSVLLYINDKQNDETLGKKFPVNKKLISKVIPFDVPEINDYLFNHYEGFLPGNAPRSIREFFNIGDENLNGLIIPIILKEKLVGVLFFTLPDGKDEFSDKETEFAHTLSVPAGLALENALLYHELQEQERLKRELEIAREVQQRLLPKSMPKIVGYAIDAFCTPASEVGGDYYDFFELPGHCLGIVIADVSGKGTSASFYMAQLKGMMLQLAPVYESPTALLTELNEKLYFSLERNMFITMLYGILNYKTNELQIGRAGHNSLIHIREDKSYKTYTPSGIGLGMDSGEIFRSNLKAAKLKLQNNDTLVFYTDGIIEAMNEREEEFGEDRLLNAVLDSKSGNVIKKREIIQMQMANFLNNNIPQDDITLIIIDCNF